MSCIGFNARPVTEQCYIAIAFARDPDQNQCFNLPIRNRRIVSPALHDSIRAQMIESFIDRVTAAKAACSDGNEETGKKMLVDVIGDELDPESPSLGHPTGLRFDIYCWWASSRTQAAPSATTASSRTQAAPS